MKIFQTNAALGFSEWAYLIRLNKSENGFNYLCVDKSSNLKEKDNYQIGKVVKDLEDYYVIGTSEKIEECEIFNTFAFQIFYKIVSLKKERNIYQDLKNLSFNAEQIETIKDYIFEDLLNIFNYGE